MLCGPRRYRKLEVNELRERLHLPIIQLLESRRLDRKNED